MVHASGAFLSWYLPWLDMQVVHFFLFSLVGPCKWCCVNGHLNTSGSGGKTTTTCGVAMDAQMAQAAMMEAMREQLEALQGKTSGLVESMPKLQRRRIQALLAMQERCDAFRKECQEKIRQAQRELREQCAPIHLARKELVAGDREPTADELPDAEEEDAEEGEENEEEEVEKGIPDFWNVVLQSHGTTEEMVRMRRRASTARESPTRGWCTDITPEARSNA